MTNLEEIDEVEADEKSQEVAVRYSVPQPIRWSGERPEPKGLA